MPDKEMKKRRERDKETDILAHSIAKTAVSSIENTTYFRSDSNSGERKSYCGTEYAKATSGSTVGN